MGIEYKIRSVLAKMKNVEKQDQLAVKWPFITCSCLGMSSDALYKAERYKQANYSAAIVKCLS